MNYKLHLLLLLTALLKCYVAAAWMACDAKLTNIQPLHVNTINAF